MRMTTKLLAAAALSAATLATLAPQAMAQATAKEQFFPVLVYRTGPYAPNGVPFANGYVDYLKMINARDGGIGGVKITMEECETGYATDRGVECYERLKGKGPTGATAFHPLSTGITFALTEKAPNDKVPIVTMGYGRSESQDGRTFPWNFPLGGTYWIGADVMVQHIAKKEGGFDKLKGKKVALVYHDSPFGKEPIALLQERSKMHGFDLQLIPVTAPGVEQKAAWLQVRQSKPDYVFLWGWGVMNTTAIKEAVATGYPREKMYGIWWSAAEPDVTPVGDGAKGYNGLNFLAGQGATAKVHADIIKLLHGKNDGAGPKDEVGSVLYNRGMVGAAVTVEAVRKAQEKFGKRPLTGTEVRWGLENLNLDAKRITALGLDGYMTPISSSCADHMGATQARVHTWDGAKWNYTSDVITADMQVIKPLVNSFAAKYAADKKITVRDCAKEIL